MEETRKRDLYGRQIEQKEIWWEGDFGYYCGHGCYLTRLYSVGLTKRLLRVPLRKYKISHAVYYFCRDVLIQLLATSIAPGIFVNTNIH